MKTMCSSIGPALTKQLIASLGASKVSVQGVDYTATIRSNALRGSEGGEVMAKLTNDQLARCDSTKIPISGCSQGAMVVHYAVKSGGLSPSVVSAAVVYGDSQNRESVGSLPTSKTKVLLHRRMDISRAWLIKRQKFCARGDGVCETGGFAITAAHLGKRQKRGRSKRSTNSNAPPTLAMATLPKEQSPPSSKQVSSMPL